MGVACVCGLCLLTPRARLAHAPSLYTPPPCLICPVSLPDFVACTAYLPFLLVCLVCVHVCLGGWAVFACVFYLVFVCFVWVVRVVFLWGRVRVFCLLCLLLPVFLTCFWLLFFPAWGGFGRVSVYRLGLSLFSSCPRCLWQMVVLWLSISPGKNRLRGCLWYLWQMMILWPLMCPGKNRIWALSLLQNARSFGGVSLRSQFS